VSRILIVDDDVTMAAIVAYQLEAIDCQLIHAESGELALQCVDQHKPDLVLTDLRMPGMDGLELIKKLHQTHPQIPIIMMTAYGDEAIAVEALKAGASSYLSKQAIASRLTETVQRLLEVAKVA